jgi:hypothetical protein
MKSNIILQLIIFILVTENLFAQQKFPRNVFISPMEIPLKLSGTFGELRTDHFHSGIDIKTGEIEGLKVYAVADGYVSRIKVAAGGYGNALYITHPAGYVSVYGHLQKYNETIGDIVRSEQYKAESFEVDLYLAENQIQVKQGDIIALTGNSGSSGGPHLHFEIRDGATQYPCNPLLFGLHCSDNSAPVITQVKLYAFGTGFFPGKDIKELELPVVGFADQYHIKGNDTIIVAGDVYFGINTIDLFNEGLNKNGIFSLELYVDSTIICSHSAESFSFDETRYINSLIDYKEFNSSNTRYLRSYVQPNNHLRIYKNVVNRGILTAKPGYKYKITYKVKDAASNTSRLIFWIRGGEVLPQVSAERSVPDAELQLFSYHANNFYKTDKLTLEVPGKALYEDLLFHYKNKSGSPASFSCVHQLHTDDVPLHTWCSLSIWPDSLPLRLKDKALIAKIDKDGNARFMGGNWDNGFLKTQVREFGNYCIMADTIPPVIIPVNIEDGKSLIAQNTIRIEISDDFSGIRSYRATLNGNWILMEFDAKINLLTYRFDNHLSDGENLFELKVSDEKNNISRYSAKLYY